MPDIIPHQANTQTTKAENCTTPSTPYDVHLCRSAPLTHTDLPCSSTVKVPLFPSNPSQSFNCRKRNCMKKIVWDPEASCAYVRVNGSTRVVNKPVFECSPPGPCQAQALICLQGVSWQPCLFAQRGRLPV